MRLHDITERMSDIVYHTTNLINAEHILKDNIFKLSTVDKQEEPFNNGYHFYMSTSRNLDNFFIKILNDPILVSFKLKGNIFNHTYKSRPVNYFDNPKRIHSGKRLESEDRILSNKNTIPNALDYISEIIIFVDHDRVSYIPGVLLETLVNLPVGSIPTFVYFDRKSFINNDKRKSKSLQELETLLQ